MIHFYKRFQNSNPLPGADVRLGPSVGASNRARGRVQGQSQHLLRGPVQQLQDGGDEIEAAGVPVIRSALHQAVQGPALIKVSGNKEDSITNLLLTTTTNWWTSSPTSTPATRCESSRHLGSHLGTCVDPPQQVLQQVRQDRHQELQEQTHHTTLRQSPARSHGSEGSGGGAQTEVSLSR